MRGFFAALRMTGVGVEWSGAVRTIRGFFAALRMTGVRGGCSQERWEQMQEILRCAQNDRRRGGCKVRSGGNKCRNSSLRSE